MRSTHVALSGRFSRSLSWFGRRNQGRLRTSTPNADRGSIPRSSTFDQRFYNRKTARHPLVTPFMRMPAIQAATWEG